jgi:exodeoxyribonuclease V beta subunit
LEGINLIDASAGTGKTYTIEGLFLRLILEKQFRVDQILVVPLLREPARTIYCWIC